ncbi:MAG: IS5/IS1182 family transposase, partial [Pseudonocardiaceae bacterium]|nr:IS5/IS1182 family transposase [Pseudonocardiaceae bacterium]
FALLTQRWHTLQQVTVSPSKISKIAQAALVLTHFEHDYLAC